MRDTELIGLARASVCLVNREARSVDGSPDGFSRFGIVQLERKLRLSWDHPDTDTAPDNLSKQKRAIGENRIPGLGLGLESIVGRQGPCCVGLREMTVAGSQRGDGPEVAVLQRWLARLT